MNLTIEPLTPGRAGDYLTFFEGAAFSDHKEWSWCYCTFYHIDRGIEEGGSISCKTDLRAIAERLIAEGRMCGYLAYVDGEVVAWCNVGPKEGFRRLRTEYDVWGDACPGRTKSVVCFLVAAPYRRQGIARQMLARAAEDAVRDGYACLEAYPSTADGDMFEHYHGHAAMYAAAGFEQVAKRDHYMVMRKSLD